MPITRSGTLVTEANRRERKIPKKKRGNRPKKWNGMIGRQNRCEVKGK